MAFIAQVASLISVSDRLREELMTTAEQISFSKNEEIVAIGERCNDLYFVESGLLRGYYLDDGKEITNWFAQEDEFATCFYSFVAQKPSVEVIEALEDTTLLKFSYSKLQELYLKFPETERLGRIIMETYYIKLEERLLNIQFKTAKERYKHFAQHKSSLLQRSSLGQIASYLGITQETLSRIRSEA